LLIVSFWWTTSRLCSFCKFCYWVSAFLFFFFKLWLNLFMAPTRKLYSIGVDCGDNWCAIKDVWCCIWMVYSEHVWKLWRGWQWLFKIYTLWSHICIKVSYNSFNNWFQLLSLFFSMTQCWVIHTYCKFQCYISK